MSKLIHIDSFDHYDDAQSYIKNLVAINVVTGRTGNGAVGPITKVFNEESIVTVGCAFKSSSDGPSQVIVLENPASQRDFQLSIMDDTRFYVSYGYFGDRVSSDASLVTVYRPNWWCYVELQASYSWNAITEKVVISFSVRLNEELILTDTVAWGGPNVPTCTRVRLHRGTVTYDDLYITDDEFLGDIEIYVIRPDGEGDTVEWDALGAGNNCVEVDDINPDFDTSYIFTSVVNKISMVTLEDITVQGTIKGIQVNTIACKDDVGGAAFKQYNKISSTIVEGADLYPSYLNWLDQTCPFRKNPITTNNFTEAEINAMQIGVKRTVGG